MSIRSCVRLILMSAIVATLGCDDPASPREPSPLRFTASVSSDTIRVGEVATFGVVLTNIGDEQVTLDFPDGCFFVTYIATESGNTIFPRPSAWGCEQASPFQVVMNPHDAFAMFTDVQGGDPQNFDFEGVLLPPGTYRLWAELGSRANLKHRSFTAELTVIE